MGIDISRYFTHAVDTQDFAKEAYDWTQSNSLEDFVHNFGLGEFTLPEAHNAGNDAYETGRAALYMLSDAQGIDIKSMLVKFNIKFVGIDFENDQAGEITEIGVSVVDSQDVRALAPETPWTEAIHAYHAVVEERLNENNGFALRKWYRPSKVDWQNLPRYNFVHGPHSAQKTNIRRQITYFDAKAGRSVTRNKNFRLSRDTETVPMAYAKDWVVERGGFHFPGAAAGWERHTD
ncbi:hypothetical protein BDV97DRAFT_152404 [Delphinella strobiligena]|nr:hypothetical protein BDV97DRAFT_152404 [Delphinella strobiligena]